MRWDLNFNGSRLRRTGSRQNRSSAAARRRSGRRPRFEALEDRSVLSFTLIPSLSVGASPESVVAADFNNDGHLDVATANAGGNSVSMLLGDGRGSFGTAIDSAAGNNPFSLAVGDFNSDGKLDLAAANGGSSGVRVMFGNGTGGFGASAQIAVGYPIVESVATGDFNNDGKMDLGVTSSYRPPDYYSYPQGRADVLLSIGDGSFAAPRYFGFWDRAAGDAVLADMNGDGNLDFVTELADYSAIMVLRGDGLGNIGNHPEAGWASANANDPSAAGDLNGDGKNDLLTSSGLLMGDGSGGFTEALPGQFYPTGYGSGSVGLGDFDRDGSLDIAGGGGVLLNTGDGSFSTVENFPAGTSGSSVAAADFNGDGWLDVAAANIYENSVSVMINDQSWAQLPPAISISDATVTEGNTGTLSATFTLTLSKAVGVDVTVRSDTADITAIAGIDYRAASGTLTIPAGQTRSTFTIAIIGDRFPEATEHFAVTLSAPTNTTIGDGQGIVAILDNEPRISINNVTKQVGKGNKTTLFTFTVTLSAAYDESVTMSFRTMNGTATTTDGDYVAKTGMLTFAPGETTKTITIEVKADNKREANESFYLDLFNNSSNSIFTKFRGIGTILNDDH